MPSDPKEVMSRRPAEEAAAAPHRERCPRCLSRDTKFCYYNNYNTAQPRHFCKSCRRYWTLGGTLRNVPIGGSSRKRLRRSSPPSTVSAPRSVISPPPIAAAAPAPAGGFTPLLPPAGFLSLGEPLLGLGFGLGLGAEMEFGMAPGMLWPTALFDEEARNTWRFEGRNGEECGVAGGGAPAGGWWRELDFVLPGSGGGAAHYPLK